MIMLSFEGIRLLLSRGSKSQDFSEEFLRELVDASGAEAGIVWNTSSRPFQLEAQYSSDDKPAKLNLTRSDHDRLLLDAVSRDTPILVRSKGENPTANQPLLFVGKYFRGQTFLVELMVQQAGANEEEINRLRQYFGGALQMVSTESGSQSTPVSPSPTVPEAPSGLTKDQLSTYVSAVHRSIKTKLTHANIANETRRLIDCDRVSVVTYQRGQFRIAAISGQPSVNRRSNATRLLEKVSQRVLKTGREFWYPEETEIPSQIGNVLDQYLAISATRSLVIVPVFEKVESLVEDPESLERNKNPVIGGIVYEHCHQRWVRNEIEPLIELTHEHSGNAMRNATQHEQLFLFPLWNLLGQSKLLAAPRMLSKTLLFGALAVLAILFLAFWPTDFYVTADGVMMPKTYKPVFAKTDGKVDHLLVDHGSQVEANQTLAVLTSREHELRVEELRSQLRIAEQRLDSIQDRKFVEKKEDEATKENIVSLKTQIENLKAQQRILDEISQSMTIKSPIKGTVITWDLRRLLEDRVVGQGNELLEVADVDGEWELDIEIPVRRYGHVKSAMENAEGELPISFLLAADTSKRFSGRLISVESNASLNANNEQVVRARAAIDGKGISIDQTRTGVTTKIICRRTSIGYLWFHEIGEFFQKHVFFRLR